MATETRNYVKSAAGTSGRGWRTAGRNPALPPSSERQQNAERHADILAQLSPSDRALVLSKCTKATFRRGSHLFVQGSCHKENYFIRSGVIRTYYVSPGGKELTLAYWSVGDLLGGPDFFSRTMDHMWCAQAVEDSTVLVIDGECFADITIRVPSIARTVIYALAFKLRWTSMLLQIQGTASVSVRLAHLLLKLCEMFGEERVEGTVIEQRFTQADLANMVGATRQWVSMTLNQLRQQGIVQIDKRRLVIVDKRRLGKISEI